MAREKKGAQRNAASNKAIKFYGNSHNDWAGDKQMVCLLSKGKIIFQSDASEFPLF